MLYGIKDAANLIVKRKKDGKIILSADYANVSTNEWTSDRVYANAKGVQAIAWDANKKGTFSAEMEVFDLKWLAMLAGSDFVEGVTSILVKEILTIGTGNKASITDAAKVGSLSVYLLESDLISHGDEQIAGTPATTANTYSISVKELTFHATTCPVGTKLVAYYMKDTDDKAQSLEIRFDKYPENYEIYADTMMRAKETGDDSFIQIKYANCKPKSNFTISMDVNNVTKITAEFDLFPDATGSMATYVKID